MKILVAGWFSFPQMGTTAGDLLTRDLVCRWLEDAGRRYDIAVAPPFAGGVDGDRPSFEANVKFPCQPRRAIRRIVGVFQGLLQALAEALPFVGRIHGWH